MSIEKKEVNDFIEKQEIRWVVVNFVDIHGHHRNISLPSQSFLSGHAWDGIDFDGSSVGFASVEKSDMTLVPDPNSYWIDPFSESTIKVHACIQDHSGENVGPRSTLKKIIQEYEKLGITPYISPEMEFYVFENMEQAILENDFMGSDIDWGGKNVMHSFLEHYSNRGISFTPLRKLAFVIKWNWMSTMIAHYNEQCAYSCLFK